MELVLTAYSFFRRLWNDRIRRQPSMEVHKLNRNFLRQTIRNLNIQEALEKSSCSLNSQEGQMTPNTKTRWDWVIYSNISQFSASGKSLQTSKRAGRYAHHLLFLARGQPVSALGQGLSDSLWLKFRRIMSTQCRQQGRIFVTESNHQWVPLHVHHLRTLWSTGQEQDLESGFRSWPLGVYKVHCGAR